jgi:uncharacterized C2H2 Zn-finger protein
MGLIASMMPVPGTGGAPFFVAAAMMMGVMGFSATLAGWSLHLITGLAIGAIFGAVVAKVLALHSRTVARTIGLGVSAGGVVWLVFFMPTMLALMPALTSMPMMIGGSFVAHLIFGLVLGSVTSVALSRDGAFKCEICGQAFSAQEDLKQHGRAHLASAQEIRCQACGMSFKDQRELMEHAEKEHLARAVTR